MNTTRQKEAAPKTGLESVADLSQFEASEVTDLIYQSEISDLEKKVTGKLIDDNGTSRQETLKVYEWCRLRVHRLQHALTTSFVSYHTHVEMLLASCIAQEPVLFLGPPGVAKTEMATNFFSGIGLRKPTSDTRTMTAAVPEGNKYFEYLLSPFSVPDELFGSLDYKMLEQGRVRRINTNMITGEKIRGVFLDEVFNASSNILNTLLTLINERRYFDDGAFKPADLKVFIGASNHSPDSKRRVSGGAGGGELSAFYDRFALRLYFPTPQQLFQMNEGAIRKEYREIVSNSRVRALDKLLHGRPQSFPQYACLNDLLVLGRYIDKVEFPTENEDIMYGLISNFAVQRHKGQELCYMSPRKAIKLVSIVLADAFLLKAENAGGKADLDALLTAASRPVKVERQNLQVFNHVWDREQDRDRLKSEVEIHLNAR
ncbi:AAA family ATPase [Gammaproteobacteria bacterium]|nr:AAA family ATPase [Gammaproteobacteria bacterium]